MMELKEALEKAGRIRKSNNADYTGNWIRELLEPILAELDKPKVFDGAPDNATHAEVWFGNSEFVSNSPDKIYTRTLPKSPEREIAEKYFNAFENIEACVSAINEYKEREK